MPLIHPNNNVTVKASLKRFAQIYLPIAMVLSIALLSIVRLDEQRQMERMETQENSRVAVAKGTVTQDLTVVDSNLRFVANLRLLQWYLDSGNPAQREELSKFFLSLARESRLYDQLRYLDANGQEVIRINFNGGKPAIVPREQLQNKSDRYYFHDTLKLNRGEIFTSPLDLNIEHGSLEIPHKPTIRFGTPVFDSAGRKKGVIVLNYLGDELLRHFREVMQGGDPRNGMLLNRDGYWLSGAKHEDEWGFMLGKSERTFGHDFPEEWRAISASEQGALLTDRGLFVYTTAYPLLSGQHSSTGSGLAHASSQQEPAAHDYYWKIVSFVPHDVLSGAAFYNQANGRIMLVFIYLLLALAAYIIARTTLARERVNAEHNRLMRILEDATDYIGMSDMQGHLQFHNVAARRMLGFADDADLSSMEIKDMHPEWAGKLVLQEGIPAILRQGFWQSENAILHRDGHEIPVSQSLRLHRDASGNPEFISTIMRDITERKKLEDELKRQACIDLLTGLNNRRHFYYLAGLELVRAKRYDTPLSVLMLDVDYFKSVNDTYGHHAGDMVLQKLSEVCVQTLRGIDIMGRLGGEEFAILLPETKSEQALEVAERLLLAIADATVPLEQGGSIHFTVSIGIALYMATDARIDDILKRADAALYAAKNAGRNRVCCK